jgi:hypothetical protein
MGFCRGLLQFLIDGVDRAWRRRHAREVTLDIAHGRVVITAIRGRGRLLAEGDAWQGQHGGSRQPGGNTRLAAEGVARLVGGGMIHVACLGSG